ncbi:hypothetical protein LR48_Vigan04g132000 [Vigna angularis]|uniref:Uncharacterized protein n=1 Tax=Phaseolus angularis TaxID=3914 RepID=A0A0L9UEZ0_PHAAN|nr:hypothetical protein LR48_Vigan04g132000 [Vigna angularis]
MADSRRTRRRTAGASSSRSRNVRPASIEGWISDEEQHGNYVHFWQERRIMAVKFIRLDFYRFYGFQFPDLFHAQGLTHLVEQKGCIYPDLICVFYFNMRYHDGIITTKSILEFRTSIVSSPFNPFLRHPEQQINRRQLLVGGFKVEERMIHYLIVWILCPRATNHAQCSEQDLLLLYGLLNHIHIDWPSLISDTMVKAKKYPSYHFPYALLISRILEYKGVSVVGELTTAIQAIGTEIGETTFRQMGFVARGRVIIHKDDDHHENANDDMDAHMVDPVPAATSADVGPSHMPSNSSLTMEEHFANLSKQLEDMRLFQQTHFEQIYEWQQNHEEFVIDQFNDLDTRIGNIENHFNLQPPERPPSPEF